MSNSYRLNNKLPLLSVVMPVHNPYQYLSVCIDSVLQQTFRDFELIVIDDASTDGSYAVLKKYGNLDSRMLVMHNEKALGAASTRNLGLSVARGEYIIFLDSDDYFEQNFFEDMICAITSFKADVVLCQIYYRDERDGTETIIPNDTSKLSHLSNRSFAPSDFEKMIFYGMPYAPFNKLIRREMLVEKKIEFQNIKNSNDVYFGIITVAEAQKVVYLPRPYVHYRFHTGTQISTNRHKNPLCICYAFQKIREELILRGLWNDFCIMYNDIAIFAIFVGIRGALNPDDMLAYVKGIGGSKLGILNLQRKDFSSVNYYCKYDMLIHGKQAMLGRALDIVVYSMRKILKGEFSLLYCLVKMFFASTIYGCKRIMKEKVLR